jgi:transglutaminase-like putative cysteine protease
MQIRVGYELIYDCPQPTPIIFRLHIHSSRVSDIVIPDHLNTRPLVPITTYQDTFGNRCSRLVAPQGEFLITADAIVNDTGMQDAVDFAAEQHPVQDLPEETLLFLLGSRYCETDLLSQIAWNLFGHTPEGWARVQAICDFVHQQITFAYHNAYPSKTAWAAYNERTGVCRDFTHLAITLCRCMNIPARYCTGYLSDIDVPPPIGPGDFAAWFEAYLGGRWHLFDPRNNKPYKGRILIAMGRDAADVPISHTFGMNTLKSFKVWTDEVVDGN